MREEKRMIRKICVSDIKTNSDKREIDAVVSEETYDRDNEKIIIGDSDFDGIRLDSYKRNPVLMWSHDYSIPPIGTCVAIEKHGKQLMAKFKFTDKTEMARQIFSLYQEKTIRAFSIGFIPDKDKFDKDKKVYGEVELLEVSAVAIPSNRPALALGFKNGSITSPGIMKASIALDTHTYQQYDPLAGMSRDQVMKLVDEKSDEVVLEILKSPQYGELIKEYMQIQIDKIKGTVR